MCCCNLTPIAYFLSLVGLSFELRGVIGLFTTNLKWIPGIGKTKPIGSIYVHNEGEILTPIEKLWESIVENAPRPLTAEEKVDTLLLKIEEISDANQKLHNKSKQWISLIIWGSLFQIVATCYFLIQSF